MVPSLYPQQILDHIKHVSSLFHLSSLTSQIETCQQLLSSNGQIEVAVFGRFKAGKSSFLNNLTGIDVLPVGVVPVTSVITKLSFGDPQHVGIHYLDGAVSTVSLQKIAEFVSEAHNPENKKGVASVVVTLPQLAPYKGITFVDTPGIGSVFQHNTLTSMDWLARVGAAIVAVSVDPPLTEGDLQLLRELQRFTPKIVVLLTKADLLSPEELNEVTGFVRSQITYKVGRALSVLPFSIKENTAVFRAALDNEILSPLIMQGATHKENILHYKLASLLQQILDYLAIAKKAAETSDLERDALRLRLVSEKQEGPLFKENLLFVRNKLQVEARPHILARLLVLKPEIERTLTRELDGHFQEWQGNLWHLTRRFEEWLRLSLTASMITVSPSAQPVVTALVENAQHTFLRIIETFQQRLAERVERVLGIRLTTPAYDLAIVAPRSPSIFIGNVFTHHLDLLWFLIPMRIFGGVIKQHLRRKVSGTLEKNLSRLATQWADTLNACIQRMADTSQAVMRAELATIETLLINTHSELSHISHLVDVTREIQGQQLCQPGNEQPECCDSSGRRLE